MRILKLAPAISTLVALSGSAAKAHDFFPLTTRVEKVGAKGAFYQMIQDRTCTKLVKAVGRVDSAYNEPGDGGIIQNTPKSIGAGLIQNL